MKYKKFADVIEDEFDAQSAAHEQDKLIARLDAKINQLRDVFGDANTKLGERIDSAEDQLHSLWGENGTLTERIDSLDDRITGMYHYFRKRINDSHAEVSRLTAMSDRQLERIEALEERLDDLINAFDLHIGFRR